MVQDLFFPINHIISHHEGLITQISHQENPCCFTTGEDFFLHVRYSYSLLLRIHHHQDQFPTILLLLLFKSHRRTSDHMCRVIYPLWGCGHAFSEPELSRWGPPVHTILCERAWEQYENELNRMGRWGFQCGYYQIDPRPCGNWERGQEILTRTWCLLCTAERDTPTSQGMSGSTSWRHVGQETSEPVDERERSWSWRRQRW